jgi:hypothetical protein
LIDGDTPLALNKAGNFGLPALKVVGALPEACEFGARIICRALRPVAGPSRAGRARHVHAQLARVRLSRAQPFGHSNAGLAERPAAQDCGPELERLIQSFEYLHCNLMQINAMGL